MGPVLRSCAYGPADCSDGTDIPQSVSIYQQNPSTGSWLKVASGTGSAAYHCNGTATKRYRLTATGTSPGAAYACG